MSLALLACANPINRHTAAGYWDAAVSAREAGDWWLARANWSRTIVNAEMGGVDRRSLSIAYYEYGRALVRCAVWLGRGRARAAEVLGDRSR